MMSLLIDIIIKSGPRYAGGIFGLMSGFVFISWFKGVSWWFYLLLIAFVSFSILVFINKTLLESMLNRDLVNRF
ncbi:hypothetical protein [Candidatus Uabimicrobium sp. HlEnr_7]|uniref:hypothetical protein n=1 Tax=Candidatus Uabimicrobium helgolandensis TaxID=3095367 RepID=UPI003557CC0C